MQKLFFLILCSCGIGSMDPALSIAIINTVTNLQFNFYFDDEDLKKKYEDSFKITQVVADVSTNETTESVEESVYNQNEAMEKKIKKYIVHQLGKLYPSFSSLTPEHIIFNFQTFNHSKSTILDNDLSDFVKSVYKTSALTSPMLEINIFILKTVKFHSEGDKVLGRSKLYQNAMFLFEAVLSKHRDVQNLSFNEVEKQALFFLLPSIQTILHEFGHLIGTLSCFEKPSSDRGFHCTTHNCLMDKNNNGMSANNLYSSLIENVLKDNLNEINSHFCSNCQSCLLQKVSSQ